MKTLHRARRRAAGFTLIETLIVLLLLGIMITLVTPNFLKAIQHQKLTSTAQQTAVLMRLARLQAIKTAINSVVQIDTVKGTVTAFSDANNNQTLDSTEKTLGRINLSKGVTIMAVDRFTSPPTPAVAVFRSDGSVLCPAADLQCTATKSPGAFRFQNSNGDQIEARVVTATGGRIVLQKYNGSTWLPNGEGSNAWKWN